MSAGNERSRKLALSLGASIAVVWLALTSAPVQAQSQADACLGPGDLDEQLLLLVEAIPIQRDAGALSEAQIATMRQRLQSALAAHRTRGDHAALCREVAALRREFAPAAGPTPPGAVPVGQPGDLVSSARCDGWETAETIGKDVMVNMMPPEAGGWMTERDHRDFSIILISVDAQLVKMPDQYSMRTTCLAYLGIWILFAGGVS